MKSSSLILAGLVLATFFSGCDGGRSASTTSETENVVTAREMRIDSILPDWIRPDTAPIVATLRLDRRHLDFSKTDSAGRDLDLVDRDGNSLPFEIVYWDKRSAHGRLLVRIARPASNLKSRIGLRWAQPLITRSNETSTWSGVSPTDRLDMNSQLVDDFEDGDLTSLLPTGSSWYSSAPQESTSIEPLAIVRDSASGSGKAIQVKFVADHAKYRYVVLGIDLGTDPISFHGLDSITLKAHGPTTLSVALEHNDSTSNRKAWIHFTLDSTWQSLTVRPVDFLPADTTGGNYGWEAVRDSVTNLTFILSGGGSVRLDDIRFHGLNRDDFR